MIAITKGSVLKTAITLLADSRNTISLSGCYQANQAFWVTLVNLVLFRICNLRVIRRVYGFESRPAHHIQIASPRSRLRPRLIRTIPVSIPDFAFASAIVLSPNEAELYAVSPGSRSIAVIDVRSGKLTRAISVPSVAPALTSASDGLRIYAGDGAGDVTICSSCREASSPDFASGGGSFAQNRGYYVRGCLACKRFDA